MIKKNCNVLCFLVNLFILLLFEYNYIIANPIKNDEVKLDLSVNKDNWFIMEPLTESWKIHGVSLLLESDKYKPKNPIEIKVYQIWQSTVSLDNLTLKEVRTVKVYPKDLNKKRYYTIFFRDYNHKKKKYIPFSIEDVKDRYIVNVRVKQKAFVYLATNSSDKFTFTLDKNVKQIVHNNAYIKWVTVPTWGMFAGTILSAMEKPYKFITPFFYLLLFEIIAVIIIGLWQNRPQQPAG